MTFANLSTPNVSLVGAGPGDPGLITVRGLERLRQAQVVVFDALVSPELLAEAPADAELIDVGKRAGHHKLTQDQINALLVEKARQGRRVVRLKGGDPYLFGRGAEEAAYLARHGIACEIVPGVTSGIAAPAAAGFPVTHRQIASTLTFVTGHEDPTKEATAIDYAALARLIDAGGTVCFYMGLSRLGAIAQTLIRHGLDRDMPVAVVQWGTTPRQRSVRTTLVTAADDVARQGITAPAIILVGRVAAIDEPGLDYFTSRPLFGQTVLVTRTRQQASQLAASLRELGAHVLEAPTIQLCPPQDWTAVDAALREVKSYDWLILTSVNGVSAVAERLAALELDARHLAGVKVAAVGEATAEAVQRDLGIRPDLVPTRFVGESLAGELIARHDVKGRRMLLLRADIARPALPRMLCEAGAEVVECTAYATKIADALPEAVLDALRQGEVDWVTFTSASTARNLATLLGDEADLLRKVKIASIGPITSDAVRELGLQVTIESAKSDVPSLVQTIVQAVRTTPSQR